MKLSNRIQVPRLTSVAALSMMEVYLSGCTYAETRAMQKDIDHSAATAVDTPIQSHLVVQVHEGSLLMGEKISASRRRPRSTTGSLISIPVAVRPRLPTSRLT